MAVMTDGRGKSRDQPGSPGRDGFVGHEVGRLLERRAEGLDAALGETRAAFSDAGVEAGGGGAEGVAGAGAVRRGGGPSAPGTTAAIADSPTSNAVARLGMAVP